MFIDVLFLYKFDCNFVVEDIERHYGWWCGINAQLFLYFFFLWEVINVACTSLNKFPHIYMIHMCYIDHMHPLIRNWTMIL